MLLSLKIISFLKHLVQKQSPLNLLCLKKNFKKKTYFTKIAESIWLTLNCRYNLIVILLYA